MSTFPTQSNGRKYQISNSFPITSQILPDNLISSKRLDAEITLYSIQTIVFQQLLEAKLNWKHLISAANICHFWLLTFLRSFHIFVNFLHRWKCCRIHIPRVPYDKGKMIDLTLASQNIYERPGFRSKHHEEVDVQKY